MRTKKTGWCVGIMKMLLKVVSRHLTSKRSLPLLLSPQQSYELYRSLPANDIVFVDATWHLNKELNENRIAEHCASRLPGSVYFDIDSICDINSALPHMLPDQKYFCQQMGRLGISNSTLVIVYNTTDSFSAARVWWTFRVFKHSLVCVLDGGLNAWIKAGYPIETGQHTRTSCVYNDLGFQNKMVATLDDLVSVVRTGSSQICDVRPNERYLGLVPEPRPGLETGHIPGSLNIPFRLFLQDNDVTKFKSPKELDDIFQKHGIVRNARVVFSCGSGITASIAAFSRCLTGVPEILSPVYDGSWAEWGSRVDTPKIRMKSRSVN